MWNEFKKFALRGNLVDLTIGFVIGAAFTKVVQSIVNDIIMPPFGLLIGRVDFSSLYINLSHKHYATFAAAKAAGAPTINIGQFINNVIDFLIISIVMFIIVRQFNRLAAIHHKKEAAAAAAALAAAPATPKRTCPYCCSEIADEATRCPHCTSHITKVEIGGSTP